MLGLRNSLLQLRLQAYDHLLIESIQSLALILLLLDDYLSLSCIEVLDLRDQRSLKIGAALGELVAKLTRLHCLFLNQTLQLFMHLIDSFDHRLSQFYIVECWP